MVRRTSPDDTLPFWAGTSVCRSAAFTVPKKSAQFVAGFRRRFRVEVWDDIHR
jgi:hypothetical protein